MYFIRIVSVIRNPCISFINSDRTCWTWNCSDSYVTTHWRYSHSRTGGNHLSVRFTKSTMSGQETFNLMHTYRHMCGREEKRKRKPYTIPIGFLCATTEVCSSAFHFLCVTKSDLFWGKRVALCFILFFFFAVKHIIDNQKIKFPILFSSCIIWKSSNWTP